ncbi:unnamed protein product [Pleuronectes platessa]|uniref:Plus3 domain-containing protein n=1 Tax=Pleuronectes platessa TaxID=8262 RepID=A0A9N7V9C4_PLEPL|nr:unnamed protein product [Pleuronectes platessa]
MSSVAKRKSLVTSAPSASAGTKRLRQVEHDNNMTQPAFPPEELRRIYLSFKRLEKWCHMPFFANTVTGCFVRVVTGASLSDPPHCVAEIVSVMESKNIYQFGSKRTNLVFKLRHASKDQIVTLRSASNQEFTSSELMQWKLAMMAAGKKVPTTEMISSKEKTIQQALDHTFTQGDFDFIVAQKNRFRAAPLNVAKRKLLLLDKQSAARKHGDDGMVKQIQDELTTLNQETKPLSQLRTTERCLKIPFPPIVKSRKRPAPKATTEDYHIMDPFTRRRTRPIMVTSLKKESIRTAVNSEMDLRYGPGFLPENED